MKAKTGVPVSKDKINLGDAAPIPAPFLVYCEPTSFCNISCKFCPNPKIPSERKSFMSEAVFNKIISDIKALSATLKVFKFCGIGEPLMHPKLPDMIKTVSDNNAAENIIMYTNGVLLNSELNRKIVGGGLNQINISVNALNDEDYFDITGVRVDFAKYVENIRNLYENRKQLKIYVKINHLALKFKEDEQKFFNTFGNISDYISIEGISHIFPEYYSEGERHDEVRYGGGEAKKRQICAICFKTLNVNANGTVSPCSVDWAHKVIVGNLHENSLDEIWNGIPLRELRKRFCLDNIAEGEACYDCEDYFMSGHENLDDYAEKIMSRLI
jgi:radical SAM protein with 4Fe4S-binding SPASM domain